jgi:hypothetical protein
VISIFSEEICTTLKRMLKFYFIKKLDLAPGKTQWAIKAQIFKFRTCFPLSMKECTSFNLQ